MPPPLLGSRARPRPLFSAELLLDFFFSCCHAHLAGLDDGASCSEQICKRIGFGVRDIHACLVMVDDDLMEANLGETGGG